MPGTQVKDILLLDLPVALWSDTMAHHEVLRERLAPCASKDPDSPAGRLLALLHRLDAEVADVVAPSELELRAAAARGRKEIDLAYGVPASARDDLAALIDAYEAADRYLRSRKLADVATPKESAAFRRWFLGEVVGQLDGAFPKPWRG